jgi:hypothetical protein
MKRFLLLSLVIAAVAISSCRREDDPEPVSPIVGTWHLTEVVIAHTPVAYREYRDLSLSPSSQIFGYILSEIIILREDNTFTIKRNYLTYLVLTFEGTYEFVNNELTLNYDDDDEFSETYSFSDEGTLKLNIENTNMFFPRVDNPQSEEDYDIFAATTTWIYRKH